MHSRKNVACRGHGCGAAIGGLAVHPRVEGACTKASLREMTDGRDRLTEMRGSIAGGASLGAASLIRALRCLPRR